MKKLIFLLFLTVVLPLQGQNSSASYILDAFASKVREMAAVEAEFSFNSAPCKLYMEGQMYRLVSGKFEVFCDGLDKWTYNKEVEEVVLVPNDSTQTDIMENPMAFFLRRSKDYKYPSNANYMSKNGRSLWEITLRPAKKQAAYEKIILRLYQSNLMPAQLLCQLIDGSSYVVDMLWFEEGEQHSPDFYRFKAEEHPDAYLVDLR